MQTHRLDLMDLAITLFVITAVPSIMVGYDWKLGIGTLAVLFSGLLLYWILTRLAGRSSFWERFAAIWLGLGGLVSLYFISQTGRLEYTDKVDVVTTIAGVLVRITPDFAFWKPLTNSIAVFLEGLLFLAIGMTFEMRKRRAHWVWIGLMALIGLAIFMSSSRGAWLGIFFAGWLWLALRWRLARWSLILTSGVFFVVIVYVLSQGSLEAFNDIPVFSSLLHKLFFRPDRIEVYRNSLALIAEYPYTGIGLGNQFGIVYSRYQLLLPYLYLSYSHNMFLEVWLQQGLAGAVAWVGLIVTIVLYVPRQLEKVPQIRAEAVWIGLIAILLHGITDARMFEDLWCWIPFFSLLGLLGGVHRLSYEIHPRKWGWIPYASMGLFLVVMALVFKPLSAAWFTNLGSLSQEHSDLSPDISVSEKKLLRDRAVTYFSRSIKISPAQRPANYRLGIIDLEDLNIQEALVHLMRAHAADTGHNGTQKALGMAYTFAGDLDRAEPLLKDKLQIIDELNYWGGYFRNEGPQEYSLNAYRLSLRLYPNQPDLINYLKYKEGKQ